MAEAGECSWWRSLCSRSMELSGGRPRHARSMFVRHCGGEEEGAGQYGSSMRGSSAGTAGERMVVVRDSR